MYMVRWREADRQSIVMRIQCIAGGGGEGNHSPTGYCAGGSGMRQFIRGRQLI